MRIEFVVRSPVLNSWDAVYLAGDHDAVGGWQADGLRLEWDDGAFVGAVDLPPDTHLHYLFTRGDWRSGELAADGLEAHPRHHFVRSPQTVEATVPDWGRGSVRYHHGFGSRFLPHARTVSVYLPPGYDRTPERRYPVFYMHDGQNLFDAHTAYTGVPWGCDDTAERLVRRGEVRPLIVVGVANTPDRLREYGPRPGSHPDAAADYGRFLVEEVKPFIDAEYRTRPGPADTGVGGSSMGGLISLHLCRTHPDVFHRCAALSPSLWWDHERLVEEVGVDPGGLGHCRVWLDNGMREGYTEANRAANLGRTRRLARILNESHPSLVRYHEDPDGSHNEHAWGHRYPDVLRFLFPTGGE